MQMVPGVQPLPPYTDPRAALRQALPALRPADRMTVTEAAERHMYVKVGDTWQKFRREVAPYMVEPTDMIADRTYRCIAFAGPSQSGKTLMLQTALAWVIAANPGRVALFQMTREAAAEFERNKFSPMIRNSPDLRTRQASGRGADNLYQKLFTGGTQLTLDWPTITKLSSQTIRLVLATDFDHFPESVDGEGDPLTLMRARTRSFMSRGKVVVESSPGKPMVDENWRPETVHDCPPVSSGILSVYPQGTRARWYWDCPLCGAAFEPAFKRLVWPESADPTEAGEAARMRCPHCEGLFGHELKQDLNRQGRWLHETADGTGAVTLGHPDIRRSDTLSYWLDGTAAAFESWANLVTGYCQALRQFEATGDEEKLRAVTNTGFAQPYLPRGVSSEHEITVQRLRDKARGVSTPKAVLPSWARYVTVSVDVQGTRFVVGVTAWGENGRHQPVDRFDIMQAATPAAGGEGRAVRPFEIAEDWDLLAPLASRHWPVDGSDLCLRPVALVVDMQGGGATTENAYRFWRQRRRAGEGRAWFVSRGRGGQHRDRVWLEAPERARGGRMVASDVKILNMATDRLKDAVATSLLLQGDGQNRCDLPEWMGEAELLEFTAERRGADGWQKRPGMVRNESLDHLVQARALHIIIGAERIDWLAPPVWALADGRNPFSANAVQDAAQDAARGAPAPATDARAAVAGAHMAGGGQVQASRAASESAGVYVSWLRQN